METAESWFDKGNEAFNAGNFEEAIRCYTEVVKIVPTSAIIFYNWGTALLNLARIKKEEALYREAFGKFDQAIEINPNYDEAFYNWGEALYELAQIRVDDKVLLKRAEGCFKKSERDILGIFVSLDQENRESVIQSQFLHSFLDPDLDADDSRFFNETIKEKIADEDELKKYKDVYIRSIFILSQLHVKNKNEKAVAYYTKKTVSQKMLSGGAKFRLNVINYSNDPTEGTILLNYLFGKNDAFVKGTMDTEYKAFAGCFTFNYDSLNQFRLYGKEGGKEEGTGLSLVFKKSFFSEEAKMATKQDSMDDTDTFSKDKDEKHALFRCIYIDPETGWVQTVGQKDEYLFYRKEKEGDTVKDIKKEKTIYDKYNSDISAIVESVRSNLDKLKDLVKDLDQEIVGQLLINLRYLTKHIAFKEEQECRIVKIHRLSDEKIHPIEGDDYTQMYVEYAPEVARYVEKIYFGPKVTGSELFQDILKHKGRPIPCEKSTNPLA